MGWGMICKLGIMSLFLPQGCIFEGLGAIVDIGVWVLLVNVTELVPCSDILGEVDPDCSQHQNGFHFLPRERSEICPTFGCYYSLSSGKLLKRHTQKKT